MAPHTGKSSVSTSRLTEGHASDHRTDQRRAKVALATGGLLVTAFIAFASHEWGATWHSIIGIGALGVVVWHLFSQRRWAKSAIRRRMAHPERKLVVFNTALALTFVITMVSGFPVWLADANGILESVHTIFGQLFLPLVIGHLILNRRRLATKLRRRPITVPNQ